MNPEVVDEFIDVKVVYFNAWIVADRPKKKVPPAFTPALSTPRFTFPIFFSMVNNHPSIDPKKLSESQLAKALSDKSKATESLKRKYEGLEEEVLARLEKFDQVNNENMTLKRICTELKTEVQTYSQKLQELDRKRERLQRELTELNREADVLRSLHEDNIDRLLTVCVPDIHPKLICLGE